MEPVDWKLSLAGLLIGVLVGTTGMGGGSLMTPILVVLFGFKPTVAIGTDILHGAVFKSFGAVRHRRLGTVHARLGSGPNAKQMERASRFIEELCRREGEKGPDCGLTSVYTPHDNLVAPQDTSRLPWARNIPVPGRGHVDILASNRLATIVLKELREAGIAVRD